MGLLAVMEAIQDQNRISQRELARKTGLNLKKVNFCLHKLLEKGYVKFQKVRHNPDKRVYLYILTPAGLKAKSRLTYGFLKFTLGYYSKMEEKLAYSIAFMRESGVRRLILYGASDVVSILLGMLGEDDPRVVGIADDDVGSEEHQGVQVFRVSELNAIEWDGILITALDGVNEAEQRLLESGISQDRILTLA